ncbi:MAG: flagellar biosynthesis protein FlhB [Ignavibacteria bacterium]|nr:MAG: flagellar biosynthesis protein FlhB [Ignavibacteria bacterium]
MADVNGQEKTEQATPRKLQKSREEGQVARSNEISSFAVFGAGMLILLMTKNNVAHQLGELATEIFANLNTLELHYSLLQLYAVKGLYYFVMSTFPFFAGIYVITLAANIFQVGFKITPKAIRPKFSKINPLQGLKKVFFSSQSIVETFKSLAKFVVVFWIVYIIVEGLITEAMKLAAYTIPEIVQFMSDSAYTLIIKLTLVYAVIAAADFIYQKYKFKKDQMMTKQEVKDEMKQTEGNPEIKGRIKSVQAEMSRKRMIQELPTADVVITNPTHFAVALKYDPMKNGAPVVIAKGMDGLAQKIKSIAREHNIHIYEDKPLARMLYKVCDVGDEIPNDLFEAVAKVLAFVYNLKNKTKKSIV